MGRIKQRLIKRTTKKLLQEYKDDFRVEFNENKKSVEKHTNVSNKKIRNAIAGHITRLMRRNEEE